MSSFSTSNQMITTISKKQYKFSSLRKTLKLKREKNNVRITTWKHGRNAWQEQPAYMKMNFIIANVFICFVLQLFEKFQSHTSPGCMIVLYFFTNGERASSLNWKYNNNTQTNRMSSMKKEIHRAFEHLNWSITWEMCSAAATLGFTTSQFAMTSVFGTLPSVW